MKLEKIFLVSLLILAIVTIGAVSASEDISDDTITAIEPTDEAISQSVEVEPADDAISQAVEEEQNNEVVIESIEDEPTDEIISQSVEDVEIGESVDSKDKLTENGDGLKTDIIWYSFNEGLDNSCIKIISEGKDNGTLNVYVDNKKKASYAVLDGEMAFNHFPNYVLISPNDLGINYGTYKIRVTFVDKDTKIEKTLNEAELAILLAKIDESFSYIGTNENLTVYIKFPQVKSGTVNISKIVYIESRANKQLIPFGTAKIKDGVATFVLSGKSLDANTELDFNFTTDLGNGQKSHKFMVRKNVGTFKVSIPSKIQIGAKNYIKFNTTQKGELFISIDGKVKRFNSVSYKKYKIPNLTKGKHTLRVMYRIFGDYDDETEEPVLKVFYSKSLKITVVKGTTKIIAKKKTFKTKTKTKKYTITLKTKGGYAVKKVKVSLRVGKKTYKAKTNSKGKATFKITKLKKKGKYTAVIKFVGTKNYKKSTKKVRITVKK